MLYAKLCAILLRSTGDCVLDYLTDSPLSYREALPPSFLSQRPTQSLCFYVSFIAVFNVFAVIRIDLPYFCFTYGVQRLSFLDASRRLSFGIVTVSSSELETLQLLLDWQQCSLSFTYCPLRLQQYHTATTASALDPLVRSAGTDPAFRNPQTTRIADLPAASTAHPSGNQEASPIPPQDQQASRRPSATGLVPLKQDGNQRLSLPALSALASVASAPSLHYRYDCVMMRTSTV